MIGLGTCVLLYFVYVLLSIRGALPGLETKNLRCTGVEVNVLEYPRDGRWDA